MESAGKSALFRGLSRQTAGDEANFRGSTVVCRRCRLEECACELVDTPGIRLGSDSVTTGLALSALHEADAIVLVLRAPQLQQELATLPASLQLEARRLAAAITFADKSSPELEQAAERLRKRLGIPVVTLNARAMPASKRRELIAAIRAASRSRAVLTGFGCNVVAVLQSRGCSSCSRRSCVSLIAFGSACSYQVGASLSLFGSGGHPGLFAPYLAVVFLVGLLHTKLWHGSLSRADALPLHERAFLQAPSLRALLWRLRTVLKQFLFQAMPIFLLLCLASASCEYLGAMNALAGALAPGMKFFHLPKEVSLAVVLSIFRKDGMLTLNASNGALLRSLSGGQLLVSCIWPARSPLASSTLSTVRRELGFRVAAALAGRQMLTSVVSAWCLAWGVARCCLE